MEEGFCITNGIDKIEIVFNTVYDFPLGTSHWGGYDVYAHVKIKSGNFECHVTAYTSTGEFYRFYKQLEFCNKDLSGTIIFSNYEDNLKLKMMYGNLGHIKVSGDIRDINPDDNRFIFGFQTDQTFITETLLQLSALFDKYGNEKGVKNR